MSALTTMLTDAARQVTALLSRMRPNDRRRAHLVTGGPAFCLVRLAEDAGFEPARA